MSSCTVPQGSTRIGPALIATPDGTSFYCITCCLETEYALDCRGNSTPGSPALSEPPSPPDGLRCQALPLPTVPGETLYCCPCG